MLYKYRKEKTATHLAILERCVAILLDVSSLLIGVEGAKTLAGVRGRGGPRRRQSAEEAPRHALEPHAPGAEINRPNSMCNLLIKSGILDLERKDFIFLRK